MASQEKQPRPGDHPDALGAVVRSVDRLLEFVLISVFVALVVVVVIQVFSRYVLSAPSTWTDEVARFMFNWLGLIGAAYAAGGMRHLSIDLLPIVLKGVSKRILMIALEGLVLLFSGYVLVYGGYVLASRTLANGQTTPALGIPMGWIYMALPFSGLCIAFYTLTHVYRLARGQTPVEPRPNDRAVDEDELPVPTKDAI